MNPPVTIAVTTFNRQRYLRETLSGVLAQDYSNLEVLISDNGSVDETPAAARALVKDDPRVRFRRNDTTVPIGEHYTQCVQAARGEFFIILNDDDLINPTFVSEAVGVATRHPGIHVVVPASEIIDERGAVIRSFAGPDGEVFDAPEFVCHWLYQRPPQYFACLATVMASTQVMRDFGGYQDFPLGWNIDNLIFLQCAIKGRVGFAQRAVFSWRVYGSSFGAKITPQQIAQSSRQFVRHLRSDPRTREALAALPAAQRKEIVYGASLMSAEDFLYRMTFFEVCRECVRRAVPFDAAFCRLVLRQYYRLLRHMLTPRTTDDRSDVNPPPGALSAE